MQKAIMDHLQEENLTAAGGQTMQVRLKWNDKPQVADWTAFTGWIKEHDAFDCLYRRINEKAIGLRLEDGIIPPGIETVRLPALSTSKKVD